MLASDVSIPSEPEEVGPVLVFWKRVLPIKRDPGSPTGKRGGSRPISASDQSWARMAERVPAAQLGGRKEECRQRKVMLGAAFLAQGKTVGSLASGQNLEESRGRGPVGGFRLFRPAEPVGG